MKADEAHREIWVNRVVHLDAASVGPLLQGLRRPDERACTNLCAALQQLFEQWSGEDERRRDLNDHLVEAFGAMSVEGRCAVLTMVARWDVRDDRNHGQPTCSVRLLQIAVGCTDAKVPGCTLPVAENLLIHADAPETVNAVQQVIRACVQSDDPAIRIRAIHLAEQPAAKSLAHVLPCLSDSVPEVRRAAMLALGTAESLITTDDLLRWLHDGDDGVRRLCEEALRSRGLRDDHVRLGRLLTDSHAEMRLRVLDLLRSAEDLEPGIWLRRLSHDPAPAVRAAAIRFAAESAPANLTDRLEQMAQNDPCTTVRQLAQYYLSAPWPRSDAIPDSNR
jgi:hypothetical protein